MGMLIVGIGALACLFSARLAGSGNKVTMLGSWPEGLAALRQHGVRMLDLDGENKQYPVEVIEGITGERKFTKALVLVKSWQTEQVAKMLNQYLTDTGIALTLQNGFGNYESLAASLGAGRVALGVTTVGARMLEPGYVQFTGQGKVSVESNPKLNELKKALQDAEFQVESVPNPVSLLWGKLVINAAINPLTALLRVPNGELLERATARQLMADAAEEAASIARKQGIELPYDDPINAVEEVARNTAKNISSMLRDVMRGAPTEIEAINGAIVRAGELWGAPTPVNRILWQLVKSLVNR